MEDWAATWLGRGDEWSEQLPLGVGQVGGVRAAGRAHGRLPVETGSGQPRIIRAFQTPSNRFYPQSYEAGTIAGKPYRLSELPDEDVLQSDLRRFLALYDSCVELNDELRATATSPTVLPAGVQG
jgi:hypothetical protein